MNLSVKVNELVDAVNSGGGGGDNPHRLAPEFAE